MHKLVLKLLLTSSLFNRPSDRIDWEERITILSTLVTISLIGLYVWTHYANWF